MIYRYAFKVIYNYTGPEAHLSTYDYDFVNAENLDAAMIEITKKHPHATQWEAKQKVPLN